MGFEYRILSASVLRDDPRVIRVVQSDTSGVSATFMRFCMIATSNDSMIQQPHAGPQRTSRVYTRYGAKGAVWNKDGQSAAVGHRLHKCFSLHQQRQLF